MENKKTQFLHPTLMLPENLIFLKGCIFSPRNLKQGRPLGFFVGMHIANRTFKN
jgi:hypothetical protein